MYYELYRTFTFTFIGHLVAGMLLTTHDVMIQVKSSQVKTSKVEARAISSQRLVL